MQIHTFFPKSARFFFKKKNTSFSHSLLLNGMIYFVNVWLFCPKSGNVYGFYFFVRGYQNIKIPCSWTLKVCYLILFIRVSNGKSLHNLYLLFHFLMPDSLKMWLFSRWFRKYALISPKIFEIRDIFFAIGCINIKLFC